jgi:hypothetical protein
LKQPSNCRYNEREGEENIAHKYSGKKVSDILKEKRGGIKQAQLPSGSPDWDEFM